MPEHVCHICEQDFSVLEGDTDAFCDECATIFEDCHIIFWGIWPVPMEDGRFLGRLAWPLEDDKTTEWVRGHVKFHGDLRQYTVNDVPRNNMCWVEEPEYKRLESILCPQSDGSIHINL